MDKAIDILKKTLGDNTLISASFSAPRSKDDLKNINIQALSLDEVKVEFRHQKHNDIKTLKKSDLDLESYFIEFKQCLVKDENNEYQILLNKKRKSKIITKQAQAQKIKHNRQKNYLIPDGEKCDWLIEIGVMDENGKVKSNYYKKFRQINRFLEMVDDLYRDAEEKSYHLIDFGCGKSYLTFALYHYFTVIKKFETSITGIDLKQEVIDHCNDIAVKVNFTNLKFVHGFIHDFKTEDPIDFVVTLHACDTATDDAILFSLKHNAKKMMFVPCCQHELNKQIQNQESNIMLKHGIFKDRVTALVTDTMRTQLLEACGYKVQSMEFIDLEHTAKNILLRCVKTNKSDKQKEDAFKLYEDFRNQWEIRPYLEKMMMENNYLTI
jgi:SAM-dependent methyltransferase